MTTHASTTDTVTSGQIGRMLDRLLDKCRKNAVQLPKDIVQQILEDESDELAREQYEALRKRVEARVEARSKMIVRRVRVNRALNPEQVIDETGRVRGYIDSDVLSTMPVGEGEEVDVYFFPLKKFVSVSQYDQELASRGLVADPRAQAAVNRDDPSFADGHPNGVQWGKNNCAAFNRWDVEREVDVYRFDVDWNGFWWFGGVRKPATE